MLKKIWILILLDYNLQKKYCIYRKMANLEIKFMENRKISVGVVQLRSVRKLIQLKVLRLLTSAKDFTKDVAHLVEF